MKLCSKCREHKELCEFNNDKSRPSGKQSQCKDCKKIARTLWNEQNPDRKRAHDKKYRETHPETVRSSKAAHYKANSDSYKKRSGDWNEANPDRVRENNRSWYQKNTEKVRHSSRSWRNANPEKRNASDARRRIKKRGNLTPYDMSLSAEYRKVLAGDPCFYCETSEAETYEIDHYIPIAKGGDDSWWNLVRACKDCNQRKSDKMPWDFIKEVTNEFV